MPEVSPSFALNNTECWTLHISERSFQSIRREPNRTDIHQKCRKLGFQMSLPRPHLQRIGSSTANSIHLSPRCRDDLSIDAWMFSSKSWSKLVLTKKTLDACLDLRKKEN